MPKNSPTTSMVKTSESLSSGVGPRWRKDREKRASSQSSMRQKTATMKVLRSTSRDLLYVLSWRIRASPSVAGVSVVLQPAGENLHTGLATSEEAVETSPEPGSRT